MTATYTNTQTKETYELGGISDLAKAWRMSHMVCSRMGWNEEMFSDDVRVSLS